MAARLNASCCSGVEDDGLGTKAEILPFGDGQMRTLPYEELDHVRITETFLNNPTKFLRHLSERAENPQITQISPIRKCA
jgi:hypothetical protein